MNYRVLHGAWLVAGVSLATANDALAADASSLRPLRVVVPFVAGGGVDVVARLTMLPLAHVLGQQVIVDNRPGARAVLGAEIVARAAPDGHTLLVVSDALTVMPFIERKLSFDVRSSFAPVSLLATQPLVIAVNPSVPVQSVKDLIAIAKSKPDALAYGTGAIGHYLAGEVFQKAAGIRMVHVPYKGGVPAVIDLVGGQVPVGLTGQSPMVPFLRTGKLRALAVTSKTRSLALPDVPTLAEAGVPGVDLFEWIFVLAPANTANGVVQRLNAGISKLLVAPDIREKLAAGGFQSAATSPQDLGRMIDEALKRWATIIPALDIRPE